MVFYVALSRWCPRVSSFLARAVPHKDLASSIPDPVGRASINTRKARHTNCPNFQISICFSDHPEAVTRASFYVLPTWQCRDLPAELVAQIIIRAPNRFRLPQRLRPGIHTTTWKQHSGFFRDASNPVTTYSKHHSAFEDTEVSNLLDRYQGALSSYRGSYSITLQVSNI